MKGTPHADYGIYVDSSKSDIALELDSLLRICKKRDFGKDHIVEIDKSGISDYEYFRILPRDLEDGKDLFFELRRPTCSAEWCPSGACRVSPVMIRQKVLKRLGIARIGRIWDLKTVELVLAADVKKVFESANVTGLAYEECWPRESNDHSGEPPAFVAKIIRGTYECALDIDVGKNYCPKHSIAIGPYPFCCWTPREALTSDDFQMIHTIKVGQKEYYYYNAWWIVSRKVVELLLTNRVSGLKQATVFLKEPFRPWLIDDRHWIHK